MGWWCTTLQTRTWSYKPYWLPSTSRLWVLHFNSNSYWKSIYKDVKFPHNSFIFFNSLFKLLPPLILYTMLPLSHKSSFLVRRKVHCLLWGLAVTPQFTNNQLQLQNGFLVTCSLKQVIWSVTEHRTKELSTDLPLCCHLHEGSRAIKSSPPQTGFYAYIAPVQTRKKKKKDKLVAVCCWT